MTQDKFTNPVIQHKIMEIMARAHEGCFWGNFWKVLCNYKRSNTMGFPKSQLAVLCLHSLDDSRSIHTELTRFCNPCYTCGEIASVTRMLCADLRDTQWYGWSDHSAVKIVSFASAWLQKDDPEVKSRSHRSCTRSQLKVLRTRTHSLPRIFLYTDRSEHV